LTSRAYASLERFGLNLGYKKKVGFARIKPATNQTSQGQRGKGQNEITHLKIFGDEGQATKVSE